MSITREQRDALRALHDATHVYRQGSGSHAEVERDFLCLLDSLVAEPAEQPYGPLATVAEVRAEEDARLRADDARAFAAALLTVPREYSITSDDELAKKAHELADAFKAERKRRQG